MKAYTFNTIICLLFLFSTIALAQESPAVHIEKDINGLIIKMDYSSPKVNGRIIWGGLEPFDTVWRTGANKATTLEVSADAKIGKNKLPAGKYALFTIPMKGDSWTVIINKVYDQWGAYNYKEAEDVLRFVVKVDRTIDLNDSLKFDIQDDGTIVFAWEYRTFQFKVEK